jgi:hypothetical protein
MEQEKLSVINKISQIQMHKLKTRIASKTLQQGALLNHRCLQNDKNAYIYSSLPFAQQRRLKTFNGWCRLNQIWPALFYHTLPLIQHGSRQGVAQPFECLTGVYRFPW